MTTKQVQYLLSYLGYALGTPDGVLGPKTKAAVHDFQRDYGALEVDGLPGRVTQAALKKAVGQSWTRPVPSQGTISDTTGAVDFWKDIKYFRRDEKGIACPCGKCGGFPAEPTEKLMRLADQVRAHYGLPMRPTSTIRCQTHNDELPGSAKNSRHLSGKAMDFVIPGVPATIILAYVKTLPGVHYAYNMAGTNAVHMDVD